MSQNRKLRTGSCSFQDDFTQVTRYQRPCCHCTTLSHQNKVMSHTISELGMLSPHHTATPLFQAHLKIQLAPLSS